MRLYPISLPLKLSPGEPKIPFSLLGSCLSQPQWLKADGRKSTHQAWKLRLIAGTTAMEPSRCTVIRSNQSPLLDFPLYGKRAEFHTNQIFSWPVSFCAHQRHHRPSVILLLTTSALTISGLAGTKPCILTARYYGFSPRQMGLPPCHLLDAFTLTLRRPRHCNVICGLAWNTSALSGLNSSTVPLRVALS